MTARKILRLIYLLTLLFFSSAPLAAAPRLSAVRLPSGFQIELFAEVPGAREIALSPSGLVFVGSRAGNVYVVEPAAGTAGRQARILLGGLDDANGVALQRGDLFIATISKILVIRDIEHNLDQPKVETFYDNYPAERPHGWKFIAFGPDGLLYVPIGAPCNVCGERKPFASITRLSSDGRQRSTVAEGVRNTVGFDWHPDTRELWFTDNGRDWLGDDQPPDELNRLTQTGQHFGFPYCHGKDFPDPQFGAGRDCSSFVAPAALLEPHAAALGMRFYTGRMFPDEYKKRIFIAEHGSWNRSRPAGYRITTVSVEAGRAKDYRPFATGFIAADATAGSQAWGRPVDLAVMEDGALLVSDDKAGALYRIGYAAQQPEPAR